MEEHGNNGGSLRELTVENEKLRQELEQARKQNLAFAADLARTFSTERQKTQVLSRTQDQLARSAKLATLGQMVAAIAHDVGNLISPISGYAELLQMCPNLTENAQRYAERIQQASGRASSMLRSLTEFGSDRGGKRTPIRLETVVQAACSLLEYNLTRKGVKILTSLDSSLPLVVADSGQIEQVLVNLMVNAQHAMERKNGGELLISSKRVKVSAKTSHRKNSFHSKTNEHSNTEIECVCLEISDQGDGIPHAIIGHIFDPFFTTKEKGKGTGLGLFICHDIIEQHGGMLDVESAEGIGTTFSITLPAHVPASETVS